MNLILIACILLPADLLAADLPVKRVTLYKHGIGFFERSGSVPAGEEVRIDFKNSEMNDVLKSLIVSDANGGKISGVRYDSNATLAQRLDKYPFSIGSHEMLSAFLDRLKGARLEIKTGDRTLTGVILGARVLEKDKNADEQLTLLTDSGDVANFDLAAISSLRFLDAHLQEQLKQYLQTVAQSNSKDKRSVYIDATGAGARALRLSYITPMAIWKSSYRLSLDSANTRLEGWAIVDNTTDEDWTNVRLSVVSGRPISFISMLDTPRFGNRQVMELPEDRAAAPVVYDAAAAPRTMMKASAPPPPAAGLAMQSVTVSSDVSSVEAATGSTLGELFEYNFPGPVTIKKDQSAMLPFLQDKIAARKLLIYKNGDGDHPVNAAEITNNTAKTLDGGPITVFDGGAYAGEALVETFKAGDKRLIGYAVDYGTLVQSGSDEDGAKLLREVAARDGILTMRYAQRETHTYSIKNIDTKAKTLIIQQEGTDYQVISPKPIERTASAYRFEVHLAASATQELKVEQEQVISETTQVTSATPDSLVEIVQNRQISDSGRRQLQAIADLKQKLIASQADLNASKSRIAELSEEQNRLRQNIDSLNRVKGQEDQVRQYSAQLGSNEVSLAKLRDQQNAQSQEQRTLDAQVRNAIAKLQF